ncbi:MAG: hypothetical protein H7A23_15185 [Leptospiraceae bacterium]|nr:hypothetical protein [Leptospiraceae bacterium]MCP5495896.1 hypothetical protein [Leptospiraceae bacterium]
MLTVKQKQDYNENLKEFKAYQDDLKKDVSLYKVQMKKNKASEPYYQIAIIMHSIRFINTCILINELSVAKLEIKSETYLNLGRKEIYSVLSSLEKVVGNDYDGGLGDNKEALAAIALIPPLQRLNLLKNLKDIIDKMVEAYGSSSKWKWSWPEIHFKFAVVAKNFFDFRAYERESDLSSDNYYVYREHYELIIELCNFAAQEYRSKFDLSTTDTNDLRKSVAMLDLIRKIYQITGDTDDLEKTKNLIDSLNMKIESLEEEKKKDKKKKK